MNSNWRTRRMGKDGQNHMKNQSARVAIDIPSPLYRELERQAAARSASVRDLVLAAVKEMLVPKQQAHANSGVFPLIVSEGPKVNVTNEQIYELVDFP